MATPLVWVCAVLAALGPVGATYSFYSLPRCECNGRSESCLRDVWGLRCVDCQQNTEGRHCERCKDGFYQQGAEPGCSPCRCHPTGAVSPACDSRGRCRCKEGIRGPKCDLCPEGPMGPSGCPQRRQEREDSGSWPCFCYGHSSQCSPQAGYSLHNITSTFSTGAEGWTVVPANVVFRWSPKYQDLEVISKQSPPTYLSAPEPFLGNQLLSYGQNFSFWLRLDRGVRHPSASDVVLEGAGLRVAASLGDLRSVVRCGHKISYSFRLDEQPSSGWRPQLTKFQFQKLLQNLTAIKIRATFGENGRGYLDNVKLVSAQRGPGSPARWVWTCRCPQGHEGEFCERCSDGFRRRSTADGSFSACEPCSCQGGSCDPQTGDCYSADETPGEQSCLAGFYRDPAQPGLCLRCPCPVGTSCSLPAGSVELRCDLCPPGTIGLFCDRCQEGFYGDPAGLLGPQRPCRPCSCNGHIDVRSPGSCDRTTGACLKCLNNTSGRSCQDCVRGFYHSRPTDACIPCRCDASGSQSEQNEQSVQCRCPPSYEESNAKCPACFNPIKAKMDGYPEKLNDLETMIRNGGMKPAGGKEMEAVLKAMEAQVENLQEKTQNLTALEENLQDRLSSVSSKMAAGKQKIQNIMGTVADIKQLLPAVQPKVEEVEALIHSIRRQLEEAQTGLESAVLLPLLGNMKDLAELAAKLSEQHKNTATAVERTASEALRDSMESLDLLKALKDKENRVKDMIRELQTLWGLGSAQLKVLEKKALKVSSDAEAQSKMAASMLKGAALMEKSLPGPLKEEVEALERRLTEATEAASANVSAAESLQDAAREEFRAAADLLREGGAARQEVKELLERVADAKELTEKSLRKDTAELDAALLTLSGFEREMSRTKAEAADAAARLPGLGAAVQEAAGSSAAARAALEGLSRDHAHLLGNMASIQELQDALQKTFSSLPPRDDLLSQSSKLSEDAGAMKRRANQTYARLEAELEDGRRAQSGAEEAASEATEALRNAGRSRQAAAETLSEVNRLLSTTNDSAAVDETQLKALEESLDAAEAALTADLTPRLRHMEERETAQRRLLATINLDIRGLLEDIANLEDVLKVVPNGCLNSQPIEEA